MAERDLPSIEEFRDGMAGVAPTMRQQIDRLTADLAACRAQLAALVDGIEAMADANTNTAAALATLTIADASISARAWLAAHPAEGGQDGAVR